MSRTTNSRCSLTFLILTMILAAVLMPGSAVLSAQNDPAAGPGSFSHLVKQVGPSVVNISVEKVVETQGNMPFAGPGDDQFNEFYKRFFGDRMPHQFRQQGLGSGFVIEKDGYILTNNHVVEGSQNIEVTFKNKQSFKAEIVGRDPKTDLALIKIEADRELQPLRLGNSDDAEVGDWVVAVGSPFGLGDTVTAGIISAKFRRIGGAYDDYIQTDASINPGNSGGPLLNVKGEVIGVNTAIFSRSGGNIGIGFAIPINIAKDLLPQLKKGEVIRGWLGVGIQEITPPLQKSLDLSSREGALVSHVTEGSPADKAGIQRGDVIVSFDGQKVSEMHELPMIVAGTPVGKKVSVEVIRKGDKKTLQVEVGKLQEEKKNAVAEEDSGTPQLGINIRDITPELAQRYDLPANEGVLVVQVQPGSSAAEAGLAAGDVILEIAQQPVSDVKDFRQMMKKYKEGETVLLLVQRQGTTLYIPVEPFAN